MSRRVIICGHKQPGVPPPPGEARWVVVGWDQPLQTFYAQEYRWPAVAGDSPGPLLWWIGAKPSDRIATLEQLELALAAHQVTLHPATLQDLYADQDEGL